MYNQKQIQKLLWVKRLYDIYVLKSRIDFTHQNAAHNQAVTRINNLQDKIVKEIIDDALNANVDFTNVSPHAEKIITDALTFQKKNILKTEDRFTTHALEKNIQDFTSILNNRLEHERIRISDRVEEELRKQKYNELREAEIRKSLNTKFKGHGTKRNHNIVRDALHTNQCNLSFVNAVMNEYSYKVWNNGQGKGRVRPWHRAKFIQSVPIDEPFDIYGSYHAQLMYPGDLNGGAENVANCRCWLSYTNLRPSDIKTKSTTRKPKSPDKSIKNIITPLANKPSPINVEENSRTSHISKITSTVKTVKTKVKNKIQQVKINLNHSKNNYLSNKNKEKVKELLKQYKDYNDNFLSNSERTKRQLMKTYPQPKNLNMEEKDFLVRWGRDSSALTNFLRNPVNDSKQLKKYFGVYLKCVNSGLNKYDNIKFDTVLHRKVNDDFFIVDVGKVGMFETPTSTTFNPHGNKEFGDFHITILAHKGTNGGYIEKLMENETKRRHLNEWLLLNNTKYKTLYKNYNTKEAVIILI